MQATEAAAALDVPFRQIRAHYDDDTITVYQAYSAEIAIPAVEHQKLSASLAFKSSRRTWIKPSWCWMMYRAGYSYKDEGQSHILALKMKHEHFHQLLAAAFVTHPNHGNQLSEEEKERPVRVKWDPERTAALEPLPYRSIQIGISNPLSKKWVNEWIISIEDVRTRAMALKDALDKDMSLTLEDLVSKGLVPRENVYEVSKELQQILKMELE